MILVDIEESRYPGHGRRRRWRRDDYQIEDQRLLSINDCLTLRKASDLRDLLPVEFPASFHTGHVAAALAVERWVAQRIAYCLRETGATQVVGKWRGALVYQWSERGRKGAARAPECVGDPTRCAASPLTRGRIGQVAECELAFRIGSLARRETGAERPNNPVVTDGGRAPRLPDKCLRLKKVLK